MATLIPNESIRAAVAQNLGIASPQPPPTDTAAPTTNTAPTLPDVAQPPEEQTLGAETPPAEELQLPDKYLRNPIVLSLLIGKPVSAVSSKKRDAPKEFKELFDNMEALLPTGISFYRSTKGAPYVVFNALHIHPDTIVEADQQGKLTLIAPPWETVETLVRRAFGEVTQHENTTHSEAQSTPAESPASAAPPQQSSKTPETAQQTTKPTAQPTAPPVAPPPASVRRQIMSRRLAALPTGGPASGPAPGGGRVLNLLKSLPV